MNVKRRSLRKQMTAGEVRFRISRNDLDRLEWLLENHPDEYQTASALLRSLIAREYDRLRPIEQLEA